MWPKYLTRCSLIMIMATSVGVGVAGRPKGILTGVIYDENHAIFSSEFVPAAIDITADVGASSEKSTASPFHLTTNQKGTFNISLDPGRYTISVKVRGFRPKIVHVQIESAKTTSIEIVLQVSSSASPGIVVEGLPQTQSPT